MVVFQFLAFYSLLFLLGRGLTQVINFFFVKDETLVDKKIFGINFEFYYPILALFFIGNTVVILNFFTGVNSYFLVFLISGAFLFNIRKKPTIKFSFFSFLNYVLIPSILSISSKDLGMHPDTGLYHLNYQNWIRSEKIAIGITNTNERFGYSSIYDHISSALWFGDNFLLLHFLNLSFMVIFFHFLSFNLFNNKNRDMFMLSYFILLFGILDNFGFSGGRNGFIYIEGIGKPDVGFAIIFFLTNILLISSIRKKSYSNLDFFVASLMALFTIQLRVFGILCLFLLGYYLLEMCDYKLINIFKKLKLLITSVVLGISWMLKNVLISSCLFFPVEITCLHFLSWNKFEHAENAAYVVQDFHYGLPTEDGLSGWYSHWMASPLNSAIAKNFILSLLLICIIRIIFFKDKSKFNTGLNTFIFLYIVLNYYMWLYNAPAIRLAMGILLLTIGILGLGDLELRFNNNFFKLYENKVIITLTIVLCTLLVPRVYKYVEFIKNPLESNFAGAGIVETIDNPRGWGLIPKEGSECEVNIDCVPYSVEVTLSYSNFLNYKIFIPPEEWTKYGE